jgi:hypothetical protein
MGAKGSQEIPAKDSKIPAKAATKLMNKDIKFFVEKTGMTKDAINDLFKRFNQDNPDGNLNRTNFMKLYLT